ncbi:hypothetical protein HY78_00445 [Rhizorhabdus wittichii DC-6]|nr:hypothetical protein HY78_00445 [Rhizorhabdus wittichii DC-6]
MFGAIVALFVVAPMLAGCGPQAINSAGSIATPTALELCTTARVGLSAAPDKARAASMQCLIATETAYQSAARLVLVLVDSGAVKGKTVDKIRELNGIIVDQLSTAYNSSSVERRIDLADAIGAATAELLRLLTEGGQ